MPRQFAPQSLYNMMGEAHMSLHRLQEAEHWYRESLRAKADHIPAHLTYAKLLAIRGRKQEAEQYFLKAIDLNPRKGSGYMHYGQFLLEESRLAEAAEMSEMAAELEIGQFDVVFNSAHMLRAVPAGGLVPFRCEAAEMSGDGPNAELEIGQFDVLAFSGVSNTLLFLLSRAAGFNSAAEKYYGIAASRRPTDPAALMNLGAILHLNGKLQRAEASYLQALQLSPDDAVTQANLRKLRNIMEKQGLKTARR
ncbi:hypothetical protein COCON_G00231850 [Conger conger]|uniref:Tetratricopeptide repeat protein n=1 Tax=Conger conger TaxID=82655 RepID=A0A9Q1CVN7_CONCO|nr:hypothetical protein COCON_G00231850 [Conger conger]